VCETYAALCPDSIQCSIVFFILIHSVTDFIQETDDQLITTYNKYNIVFEKFEFYNLCENVHGNYGCHPAITIFVVEWKKIAVYLGNIIAVYKISAVGYHNVHIEKKRTVLLW